MSTNLSTDIKSFRLRILTAMVIVAAVFGVHVSSSTAAVNPYVTANMRFVYSAPNGKLLPVSGAKVTFRKGGAVTTTQVTNSAGWIRVTARRGTKFQINASWKQGSWCPAIYSYGGNWDWTVPVSGPNTISGDLIGFFGRAC